LFTRQRAGYDLFISIESQDFFYTIFGQTPIFAPRRRADFKNISMLALYRGTQGF
jgi:hypothetical protein